MAIYYSATTNSFYDSNIIEITQMPEDSKIVTDANYKALMDAQCDGHVITANSDGTPCAITQQCGPCSGLIHDLTIATANKLGHVKGGGNVSIDANGVMNANIDLSGYALDSNVVHKSGEENINGVKTFNDTVVQKKDGIIKNDNVDITTTPSSNFFTHLFFADKNDVSNAYMQYGQRTNGINELNLFVRDKDLNNYGVSITTNNEFLPILNNIYNLGSSDLKWAKVYSTNTITNEVITYSVKNHNDTSSMTVSGGSSLDKGSALFLYGNSHAKYPGAFDLTAKNTTNESRLIGFPNGSLIWGGKNVALDENLVHRSGDETIGGTKIFFSKIVGNLQGNADTATSAGNGVDSYGGSWIRFKNGIQMCWGAGIFEETISYPKAFKVNPALICTPFSELLQSLVVNFCLKTNTLFACRLWNVHAGSWQTDGYFDWIAVGIWK